VLAVGTLDEGEEVRGVLAHCGEHSVASEGVEGVSEVHLDSDALRIGKHACMEGVANAATASWDAHGYLEGMELHLAAHLFIAHRPAIARRCQSSETAMGRTPPLSFWMLMSDASSSSAM
jgi:hypothetical protein